MKMAILCFRTAVVIALFGFALGIAMGLLRDFSLGPAHAHINLIGWVSFFLYGTFYALVPSASKGLLPRIHYALALTGGLAMAARLIANDGYGIFMAISVAGAFIVYAGLAVFAWIVFRARFEPMEISK
jgi:hypothetical protein